MRLLKLALGIIMLLPAYVLAEGVKIGVVDMRAVMAHSQQAKSAMENLKKEFKVREDKIIATENSLKKKSEKLQKDAAVMSESEKVKLSKEITASQRDLQRLQTEFQEDAAPRQQEEMRKVVESINRVVERIAKEGKYDLIIYKEIAPFVSNKIDLTEKVIQAAA